MPPAEYLYSTDIIDWNHPAVSRQARRLADGDDPLATARACFCWVRDEIQHSRDFERNPATCSASDVLQHRTGYCFAKSHLLAALLRANGIPAGFCYQRLSVNDAGPPFCLHGYSAAWFVEFGWYRFDARGNRQGIDAAFTPPIEHLAFPLQSPEEVEFDNILAEPLDRVVRVLRESATWQDILSRLPDLQPDQFASEGLVVRKRGSADS